MMNRIRQLLFHVFLLCSAIFVSVEAQRGSTCTTPNGNIATCTSIYDCNLFLKAIRGRDPSQLRFIKQSQCGYDASPLVCCGSRVDLATVRSPPQGRIIPSAATGPFTRSSAIPDRNSCGFQESDDNVEGFILGGEEPQLNEFPWMALLGYTTFNGNIKWSCGGTIISPKYILTAAHCVTGEVLRKVGQLTYVKLGEHNIDTDIDCDKNGQCNDKPLIAGVESTVFHENYNADDRTSSHDIALVRLNQRVRFTEFIRPICLPESNEGSQNGDYLTAAGWGKIEGHANTAVILKVDLPYLDRDRCGRAFRYTALNLVDSQICAGGEGGKDSCSGDSGGPLMRRLQSNQLQWYQEGIVSFGDARCGVKGLPGIYTKVSSFVPWIHSHVRN